jgi:hypothetical protein
MVERKHGLPKGYISKWKANLEDIKLAARAEKQEHVEKQPELPNVHTNGSAPAPIKPQGQIVGLGSLIDEMVREEIRRALPEAVAKELERRFSGNN